MSRMEPPLFQVAADAVAEKDGCDVLFINSAIYRPLDREVIQLCRSRQRRDEVMLILVTTGGDADAAFRVARCLQNSYRKFKLFVTGFCKSAGTLLALGASELIISDFGELGPLDVQMSKPDELLQRQSGLTATAALSTLHEQAFQAYEHFLLETVNNGGEAISTKTATHIAVQLTVGLFSRIYEHVDPMHVGESGRMLRIAHRYGDLLLPRSTNFSQDTLAKLTTGYPSHGFVIDRGEAEKLFRTVRKPTLEEEALADSLKDRALLPGTSRLVAYLSSELVAPQAEPEPTTSQSPSQEYQEYAAQPTAPSTAPANRTDTGHSNGDSAGVADSVVEQADLGELS